MKNKRRMSTTEAAEIIGMTPQILRIGLQQGAFPFGTAFRQDGNKNYTYVIFEKKFWEYMGSTGGQQ